MKVEDYYLTKLGDQWQTILWSAAGWHALTLTSPLIFNRYPFYTNLPAEKRTQWDIRVSAFTFAILISMFAVQILSDKSLESNPLFGYSEQSGWTFAVACGYFLWDSLISLWHIRTYGPGFLIHGLSCLTVYLFSFGPFANYFGASFLLFELSTPFLNIHWFMDKAGKSGSPLQFANGVLLVLTFTSIRILWGVAMSIVFFQSMWKHYEDVPALHICIYGLANVVLNTLNFVWMFKIVQSLNRHGSRPSTSVRYPSTATSTSITKTSTTSTTTVESAKETEGVKEVKKSVKEE